MHVYTYREKQFRYAPEVIKYLTEEDINVLEEVRNHIDAFIEQGILFTEVTVTAETGENSTTIKVQPL